MPQLVAAAVGVPCLLLAVVLLVPVLALLH
jgi:hypothetical protein